MKKILIGIFTMASLSAGASSECFDLYQSTAKSKREKHAKEMAVARSYAESASPYTAGAAMGLVFNPLMTGPAIALGTYQATWLAISSAHEIANLVGSREERALSYSQKGLEVRGFLKTTLKQAKKIRPNISMKDVLDVIESGFESGDFCSGKKLFGPGKIKNYVLEKI
jgi:hypothetical protein